ncbi:hypothetical protein ACFYXM_11465 [Streptomyces sp. NPDC002476]|uniref:hypothetical protein n=1 Tax=Streptomyces sp. NPDC002476 TaxID=3364648 RepID=UPI0036A95C83
MPTSTINTADAAVEAARFFDEPTGPLATLAGGTVPDCFARLRIRLADLRVDALATSAALGLSDDPDDPLEVLGRREVSDITSRVAALQSWVEPLHCRMSVCECRADRLLRALLEDQGVPVQSGYRPTDRRRQRPVALMAGYQSPSVNGARLPYVLIDHRGSISHAVRVHRGWRARLLVAGTVTEVYTSPAYPMTPVEDHPQDTQACANAVAAALQ